MHGAQDWPSVARRMWVRIDMLHGELGVTVPGPGDRVALLDYLLANALKVSEHLRAGPGRDTFEAMCSRCHRSPGPAAAPPADWPAVVMRMERNMERMRVSGVTIHRRRRSSPTSGRPRSGSPPRPSLRRGRVASAAEPHTFPRDPD